ncbi:hypothetical protein [Actinomadura montaniterrae]|nr:hypothetical protein [Actinomadura montaniterrae]
MGDAVFDPDAADGMGVARAAWSSSYQARLSTEEQVTVCVGDHHGLDHVLLVLAGDEHVAVRPFGRRSADLTSVASMIAICPLAPGYSITSASVRNRIPGATVQPRSASSGRSSAMARVMVDRLTPNQQPSTSWLPSKMDQRGQQPVHNTSWYFSPAPTARLRRRATRATWCRSCHTGPTSATNSAITVGDRQVIRRFPTTTARATDRTI